MNKLLLIGISTIFLAACSPSGIQYGPERFPVIPDGLKDCTIYKVIGEHGSPALWITRCPNSSTTTRNSSKNPITTTVIDETPQSIVVNGKTYEIKQ